MKVVVTKQNPTIKTTKMDAVSGVNPSLSIVTQTQTLANGDIYLASTNLVNSIQTYINQQTSNSNTGAAYSLANTANTIANAAYFEANTANVVGSSALSVALAAYNQANLAYGAANGANGASGVQAYNQANLAYAAANLALSIANSAVSGNGGNITGNLFVNQNVSANIVSTNTVYFNGVDFTTVIGTTSLNGTPVNIDSFPSSLYTSVKYVIQIQSVHSIQTTELMAMQDGVNAYSTEYATLLSNAVLGTFSIASANSNIQLTMTPQNPGGDILTVKLIRQAIRT